MFCLGCLRPDGHLLCPACRAQLEAVPPRIVGGLVVRAAARHDGLARRLIHDLKYRGVRPVARLMAPAMVRHLPAGATVLVPVPRVLLRRMRLGVDPAAELAAAMSRRCGLPVVAALGAPLWHPGHAGRAGDERSPVRFRPRRSVEQAVLVDDVVTTGSTLRAAAGALGPGVIGAVAATGAGV